VGKFMCTVVDALLCKTLRAIAIECPDDMMKGAPHGSSQINCDSTFPDPTS